MKPMIRSLGSFILFYRIGVILGWGFVRGVSDGVDREVCDIVYSDVGDNVESGDGGKVVLEVDGEVCSENGRSIV